MEFSTLDVVFLVVLAIYLSFRDLKKRFRVKENEIDRVLAKAEQVKYKDIIIEQKDNKIKILENDLRKEVLPNDGYCYIYLENS